MAAVDCRACSHVVPLRGDAIEGGKLMRCPICATADLYVQKDFPHRLGLTIVVIGSLVSSVAWYHYQYPLAIGILLVTAFLDLCLYYAIGDVVVCYRCLAQFRGVERSANQQPFDLGVGERYRQERLRLEKLRQASQGKPSGDGAQ